MKKFLAIFRKVGGKQVLQQYARAHVLFFALTQTLRHGFSKKGLEIVRLAVNNRIVNRLRRKNRKAIAAFTASYRQSPQLRSDKVWVCWLQGMDAAPELVRRCYRSLQENLTHRKIILLTKENYRQYVSFPEHVQQKIDAGVITRTHFSDLLRLELLIRHGGTWVDATVFCSGDQIPGYMLDSDLFVFQTLKPGLDGHCTCLSSWFMTACTNHPILLLTRHLLYAYWKTHKHIIDYFLLHDFFQLALETYGTQWSKVVPFCNSTPHILLLRLFEPYDEKCYQAICEQTPFHKLSYKFDDNQIGQEGTYYHHILQEKT